MALLYPGATEPFSEDTLDAMQFALGRQLGVCGFRTETLLYRGGFIGQPVDQ
jgi:hypothetical protein